MNTISNPPTKRRFRFSLRTLLVAITACGIFFGWLAYHLNWIRERHRAIEMGAEQGIHVFTQECAPVELNGATVQVPLSHPFPWSLSLLGEQPYNGVMFPGSSKNSTNQDLIESYQRLFPEGDIAFEDQSVVDESKIDEFNAENGTSAVRQASFESEPAK